MYMDDLPLWGKLIFQWIVSGFLQVYHAYFPALLGETDPSTKAVAVYTHKRFEIGYNDDKIVDVSVVVENKKLLVPNQDLEFTYEVVWKPSNVPFEKRFEKYLDPNFFQHRVGNHFFEP